LTVQLHLTEISVQIAPNFSSIPSQDLAWKLRYLGLTEHTIGTFTTNAFVRPTLVACCQPTTQAVELSFKTYVNMSYGPTYHIWRDIITNRRATRIQTTQFKATVLKKTIKKTLDCAHEFPMASILMFASILFALPFVYVAMFTDTASLLMHCVRGQWERPFQLKDTGINRRLARLRNLRSPSYQKDSKRKRARYILKSIAFVSFLALSVNLAHPNSVPSIQGTLLTNCSLSFLP
jgi:hypothetical protein